MRLDAVRLCYNASAITATDPDTEARRPCYYDFALTLNQEVAQATGTTFSDLVMEKSVFGKQKVKILSNILMVSLY